MSSGGQTSTTTQQSGPPPAVLNAYTNLTNAAAQTASNPYNLYTGPMVAGFTPQQQQAFQEIGNLQGTATPYLNAAANEFSTATTPLWPTLPQMDVSSLPNAGLAGIGAGGSQANTVAQTARAAPYALSPYTEYGLGSAQNVSGIAGSLPGSVAPYLAGATNYDVNSYLSPYTQNVTDALQNLFNEQNAEQLQQVRGNATMQNAYGGDREAIAEAITARQQQLGEAPALAQALQQGFQQAQQEGNTQQQLRLGAGNLALGTGTGAGQLGLGAGGLGLNAGQLTLGGTGQAIQGGLGAGQLGLASGQQAFGQFNTQQQQQLAAEQANAWLASQAGFGMASLGNEALNTGLTGAQALLGAGGMQQGLAQQQLNIPYQQFQAAQAYPYQQLSFLAPIVEGTGSLAGGTASTTSPGPSTLSQLGGLGLAGAGLYGLGSDAGWWGGGSGGWGGSNFAKIGGRIGHAAGGAATGGMGGGIGAKYPGDLGPVGAGVPSVGLDYIPTAAPGGTPSAMGIGANAKSLWGGGGSSTTTSGGGGGLGEAVGAIGTAARIGGLLFGLKGGGRPGYDEGGQTATQAATPGQIPDPMSPTPRGVSPFALPPVPHISLDHIIHPGPAVRIGSGPPKPIDHPPAAQNPINDAMGLDKGLGAIGKAISGNDNASSSAGGGRIGYDSGGAAGYGQASGAVAGQGVPLGAALNFGGGSQNMTQALQQLMELPLERLMEMKQQMRGDPQQSQLLDRAIASKQATPGAGTAPPAQPPGAGLAGMGAPASPTSPGLGTASLGEQPQDYGGTAHLAQGGEADDTRGFVTEEELDPHPVIDHSGKTVVVHFPSEGKKLDLGLPPIREDQRQGYASGGALTPPPGTVTGGMPDPTTGITQPKVYTPIDDSAARAQLQDTVNAKLALMPPAGAPPGGGSPPPSPPPPPPPAGPPPLGSQEAARLATLLPGPSAAPIFNPGAYNAYRPPSAPVPGTGGPVGNGVAVPQLDQTMFAPPTNMQPGGGIGNWNVPLPQTTAFGTGPGGSAMFPSNYAYTPGMASVVNGLTGGRGTIDPVFGGSGAAPAASSSGAGGGGNVDLMAFLASLGAGGGSSGKSGGRFGHDSTYHQAGGTFADGGPVPSPSGLSLADKLARIDYLTRDRLAAERGERADGSPTRPFSAIAAGTPAYGLGGRAHYDEGGDIDVAPGEPEIPALPRDTAPVSLATRETLAAHENVPEADWSGQAVFAPPTPDKKQIVPGPHHNFRLPTETTPPEPPEPEFRNPAKTPAYVGEEPSQATQDILAEHEGVHPWFERARPFGALRANAAEAPGPIGFPQTSGGVGAVADRDKDITPTTTPYRNDARLTEVVSGRGGIGSAAFEPPPGSMGGIGTTAAPVAQPSVAPPPGAPPPLPPLPPRDLRAEQRRVLGPAFNEVKRGPNAGNSYSPGLKNETPEQKAGDQTSMEGIRKAQQEGRNPYATTKAAASATPAAPAQTAAAAPPAAEARRSSGEPMPPAEETAPAAGQTAKPATATGPVTADLVQKAGYTRDPQGYAQLANYLWKGEASDFNILFGGKTFSSYDQHPADKGWQGGYGPAGQTHAAGLPQFQPGTWHEEQQKLGLKEFSPVNQVHAGIDKAESVYRTVTGGDLLADFKAGKLDQINSALHSTWTSLGSGNVAGPGKGLDQMVGSSGRPGAGAGAGDYHTDAQGNPQLTPEGQAKVQQIASKQLAETPPEHRSAMQRWMNSPSYMMFLIGAGMLASTSPFPGVALGQGMQFAAKGMQAAENAESRSQLAETRLNYAAQKLDDLSRNRQLTQDLSQERFSWQKQKDVHTLELKEAELAKQIAVAGVTAQSRQLSLDEQKRNHDSEIEHRKVLEDLEKKRGELAEANQKLAQQKEERIAGGFTPEQRATQIREGATAIMHADAQAITPKNTTWEQALQQSAAAFDKMNPSKGQQQPAQAPAPPPPAAVTYLKAHRDQGAAFDQKYGAGAAAQILGQ